MHSFKANSIDWLVKIDFAARNRVKATLGVDLLKCLDADSNVYQRLGTDVEFALDILYVVCQEQAALLDISKEQFGADLGGDDLAVAMEALVAETIDFFPNEERRKLMTALQGKIEHAQATAIRLAKGRLDQLDEAWIEKQMTMALEKGLPRPMGDARVSSPSSSSGGAPESAASTPPD